MATGVRIEVVMPQMGVSVSEGTITKWLRYEGDAIEMDEPLLEISTDKVDTEVPSPGTGVVQKILVQEGETVAVGTPIAVIGPGEAAPREAPAPGLAPPAPMPEPVPESEPAAEEVPPEAPPEAAPAQPEPAPAPVAPAPAAAEPAPVEGVGDARTFVSPVVARIAAEHGVDVSQVEGTGHGGRVTKRDILGFIEAGAAMKPSEAPPAAPAPPTPETAGPPPTAMPQAEPAAGELLEPATAMRKGIAEHMRRSLDTSAHVTTVFEVDLAKVVAIRSKLKPEYEQTYGVNPTFLSFIARAAVEAIRNWPWVNAELRGEQIVVKSFVNLGIAVALEGGKGLIVPVVRNAEGLNLLGLARAIADVAERARTKKLVPEDVHGGTFTITNPGGFGAIMGTPIINQPQVAILDVEALVKRPVVVSDERGEDVIAIRPMMNLCLSYDHRLVDGAYAAQFMQELVANLETWGEERY